MITELIADLAVRVLEATGYFGAGLLMALESMIAPVPSEAVMPFVGFLVADGKWSFWPAVLAASLGSLAGSAISYAMGYYGGRPFVLRVGKYLLLNPHDLEWTERFFHERRGTWTIFLCRFMSSPSRRVRGVCRGRRFCWPRGRAPRSGTRSCSSAG
jgi:membrane protein DedA with SNARE-associated domain